MIGWIGAIAFGLSGLPQALQCRRDGHAHGLSMGLLALWTVGEIATFAAVLKDDPIPYLVLNYSLNGVFLAIMWRFKLWPEPMGKVIPITAGKRIQSAHKERV